MKFPIGEVFGRLPLPANDKWKDGVWDLELHAKGNVRMIFFTPRGTDHQTSHEEDEYYFIVRGSGDLFVGEKRYPFFVPADTQHRFEEFSDDFACWAVFF